MGMYGNGCNVWEWVQSARGMQGNAGECQGNVWSGCKVPGECRGMQGNASGMHGSVCKVKWECGGMPGKCMAVGAKHQRNTGMQGNARGM